MIAIRANVYLCFQYVCLFLNVQNNNALNKGSHVQFMLWPGNRKTQNLFMNLK